MTTVDKLLHHFGLSALPFERAVPPEGLLHHPSFAEALERRLRAVGARAMLVRPGAVDLLFQHSRGIIRRLNHLATGALLAAARAGRKHVDAADVQAAVFDDEHA
jgi:type II secretory pathway predicted ATPase ExeA